MFGKKTSTPKIEEAVNKAVNYEVTIADMARRSERRAWFVAGAAILMALLLAGGYYLMLPLKERTPFLVMADPYRGTATVAQLRGDFTKNSITMNEAVNKSNLWNYVVARESYDYDSLRDSRNNSWTLVNVMSSPTVARDYKQLYLAQGPDNPIKTLGRTRALRVEIISVTPLTTARQTQGPGTGGGTAQVRFQRVLIDKQSGGTSVLDTRIANISYNYNKNLGLNDEQRVLNPLGFQVTSYRTDREMMTTDSTPVMPDGALPRPSGAQGAALPGAGAPAAPPSTTAPLQAPGQPGAGEQPLQPVQVPADPRAGLPLPADSPPNNANGVPNR